MSNTDLLIFYILLFLTLVLLVPVGSAYLADWYSKKALLSYIKYNNLREKLEKLEKELVNEAPQWPIYTRPVLFTSIDKKTQKTFGISQNALIEAQKIVDEFPSVPDQPNQALEALSPIKCAERIQTCVDIIQQEIEFNKWIIQLEEGKAALKQHHKEENRTLVEVENRLSNLKKRLSEAEKKIATITHGEKFNETVGWVINYAQIGTQASETRITASKEEKGFLNYAIADTFIQLTNYLLDHFDLSEIDISFADKFSLDRFENRLRDFEIGLKKVIEAKAEGENKQSSSDYLPNVEANRLQSLEKATRFSTQTIKKLEQGYFYQQATNAIETWEDVTLLNSLLGVLRKKLERVRSSYSFFLKTKTILLDLIQKVSTINIPNLEKESAEIESECEKYWESRFKSPLHWKEALHGKNLPSVEFEAAKALYIGEIIHYTKLEYKIKQSEITKIISKITYFLWKIENGKTSYKELNKHLKVHKDAETLVISRLGEIGTTGRIITDMKQLQNDYSEKNRQECLQNQNIYQQLITRAKNKTGANFPQMLKDLDGFENKCKNLISKHNEEIKSLHQLCSNHSATLNNQSKQIKFFKDAIPKIIYDFKSIEEKINPFLQNTFTTSNNYQQLQDYLRKAESMETEIEQEIKKLAGYWNRFLDEEKRAIELVSQIQTILGNYQDMFSMSWAWVKEESDKIIETARNKLGIIPLPIYKNREPQFNISINDAITNCQRVITEVESLDLVTRSRLSEIEQQQKDYAETANALMNMIDKPIPPIYYMFQVRPKVPEKIRELCALAAQVSDRRQVKYLLNAAEAYFEKNLTEEEAKSIIQQFYINQGLIIGEQNNQSGASVNNAARDIRYQA